MPDLKFRAILIDPGNAAQERPLQVFGNDRQEIDRWAGTVLRKAVSKDAAVNVYQSSEHLVAIIMKPAELKPTEGEAAK